MWTEPRYHYCMAGQILNPPMCCTSQSKDKDDEKQVKYLHKILDKYRWADRCFRKKMSLLLTGEKTAAQKYLIPIPIGDETVIFDIILKNTNNN